MRLDPATTRRRGNGRRADEASRGARMSRSRRPGTWTPGVQATVQFRQRATEPRLTEPGLTGPRLTEPRSATGIGIVGYQPHHVRSAFEHRREAAKSRLPPAGVLRVTVEQGGAQALPAVVLDND